MGDCGGWPGYSLSKLVASVGGLDTVTMGRGFSVGGLDTHDHDRWSFTDANQPDYIWVIETTHDSGFLQEIICVIKLRFQ